MFLAAAEVGFCGWEVAHSGSIHLALFFEMLVLIQEFQQLAFSGHVAIMFSFHSAGFWLMAW